MTAFTFDANAALKAAQKCQAIPNRPNRPNRGASEGTGFGGLGRLGAVRASHPEMTPEELAQGRQEAGAAWSEAWPAARIIALDDWRAAADDPHNPDAWRNSPTEGQRT